MPACRRTVLYCRRTSASSDASGDFAAKCGKGDSATVAVCRFLASRRAEMCALSARSRFAVCSDEMLVRRGKEVSALVPCGRRRRAEQQLVCRSPSQFATASGYGSGVSHHDQLPDAA